MAGFESKNEGNVIAFSRHRRITGKFLPTRQSQRNQLVKGQGKYALILRQIAQWLINGISSASVKILLSFVLVLLRLLHRPLKIVGRLCKLTSFGLPLVGIYLYFNPYAHMTPQLWQKGLMWEVFAISGAALWAWLEMVFESTENKLSTIAWRRSAA